MASVYLKPFTPAGDRVATAAEGHRGRNRHRAPRGWPTYVVYAVTDGGERHRPGIRHEVASSLDLRLLKDELEARSIQSKLRTSASGRISGGKPFARGALYLILRNRIYRGEIVHNEVSYLGDHAPIIDQPLWDAVQAQLASNAAERNSTRHRQPSLLAGLLFDGDGNRMTPSHAVKKGTRYRYYVSRSLITKDRTEDCAGLRVPAAEIEQLVSSRVRQWLLDPGSIYKATSARFPDPSTQRRLVARAAW